PRLSCSFNVLNDQAVFRIAGNDGLASSSAFHKRREVLGGQHALGLIRAVTRRARRGENGRNLPFEANGLPICRQSNECEGDDKQEGSHLFALATRMESTFSRP